MFLADDNVIVREGVKALLSLESDFDVVGTASDYETLVEGAVRAEPQVVVTDIRMPPSFQREGIDAAKEVRKRHPGTGVVILSQYDDPEYAIALLNEGAAGCAYLLKDAVAEGDQLARAVREVATGGSMLDPKIVEMMVAPATGSGELMPAEEDLLRLLGEGRPIKAIAAARHKTAAAVSKDVDELFLKLAEGAHAGIESSLRRLRMLHQAIIDREEQGETLSRLLPGGIAEKLRREGRRIGESERMTVTVLMSDIRGYSTIAEGADPTSLASQLNAHRGEMNTAILGAGGTVMQFVGDAVMAVFGAITPRQDHADAAVAAAQEMHRRQGELNRRWAEQALPPFEIGIGISTGEVAAALLGSEERVEYSVVGDAVNLTQRLQTLAGPGETVLSDPSYRALHSPVDCVSLEPTLVKGRSTPVVAHRIASRSITTA